MPAILPPCAAPSALRGRSLQFRKLLLPLALTLGCPVHAWAESIFGLEAGAFYDSNLTNAQVAQDVRGDLAFAATFYAGHFIPLDGGDSVTMTFDASSEVFNRFSGLNNLSLGATLSFRRKLGLGSTAPWVGVSASATRLNYADNVRSGWLYRGGLSVGRRVSTALDLRAEFSLERRTGDHATRSDADVSGAVFDQTNRNLALNANFSVSENTTLLAGLTRRVGDVVVTTITDIPGIDSVSSAETRDPVFGPDAVAYKLRAASNIMSIGVSRAVDRNASVNVRAQRQFTYGAGDNNYYKSILTANYILRF
jgi:hypothetical protein